MISNTYTAPSNGKIGAISISSKRNLLGPRLVLSMFSNRNGQREWYIHEETFDTKLDAGLVQSNPFWALTPPATNITQNLVWNTLYHLKHLLLHSFISHFMLKSCLRKNTGQQQDKTRQHNFPKTWFFHTLKDKKLPCFRLCLTISHFYHVKCFCKCLQSGWVLLVIWDVCARITLLPIKYRPSQVPQPTFGSKWVGEPG